MTTTDVSPAAEGAGRLRRVALGVPLVLLVLLGAPALVLPGGRDQAIFAVVGETIARGGMPYLDAFDFKPPGIHLVYALASLGPGVIPCAHALELVGLAIAAWGLFRLVEPEEGCVAASVASSHLVIAYLGTLRYWDLAQPEGLALPVLVGALLAFRGAGARPARALGAGVLLGAATVLKYPLLLLVLLFPLLRAAVPAPRARVTDVTPERPLVTWGLLGLGAALPVVLTGLWLAAGGALGAFWTIQTDYLPGYSRLTLLDGPARAIRESWTITAAFFAERPLLAWPPLLGILLGLATPGRRRALVPVAGVLVSVVGIALQGKFFHYHFIPMLPFLAWLAGIGVARVFRALRERPRATRPTALVLAALGALVVMLSMRPVAGEKLPALRRLVGDIDGETFQASPAFTTADHSPTATTHVARAVRRLAGDGDRLFVWGFEPAIYLESGATPASRFIYTAAFMSPWCPQVWSEEIVRDLTTRPPEIFVVASRDAIPWVTGVPLDSREALRYYPAIVELLESRYTVSGRIERFTLFTRTRADAPGDGPRAAP